MIVVLPEPSFPHKHMYAFGGYGSIKLLNKMNFIKSVSYQYFQNGSSLIHSKQPCSSADCGHTLEVYFFFTHLNKGYKAMGNVLGNMESCFISSFSLPDLSIVKQKYKLV